MSENTNPAPEKNNANDDGPFPPIEGDGGPVFDPISDAEANALERANESPKDSKEAKDEEPKAPTEKPKNKGGRPKGSKKKGPAPAPSVAPLGPDDEAGTPFAGGPPRAAQERPAPDPAPAPAPAKKPTKKIRIPPERMAAKATEALDDGAVFVAKMRYKALTMPWPTQPTAENPSGFVNVEIASLAAASPDEKKEIEGALVEVFEEWGLEVTPAQLSLGLILWTYGKRAVMMEKTAQAIYGGQRAAEQAAKKEPTT